MARVKYLLIFAIVLLAFNYKPVDENIVLTLQPIAHRFPGDSKFMDFELVTNTTPENSYAKIEGYLSLSVDTASKFFKDGHFQMQDKYAIVIYHVKR